MSKSVRTRFAPSPTGLMHVGGVRTALFAWLVARQNGGRFILRIEDTDKTREVKGAEAHIMAALSWLGLDWDEGPDKGGSVGPYRQSERLAIYQQWGRKLADAGRAYRDPFTPAQTEKLRAQATKSKKPFLFRDSRPSKLTSWTGEGALRFKSTPVSYQWSDLVVGDLSTGPEVIDDFILIKADGFPTYNFAHIIDDHLMRVSHVIRSQEFLPSVPKFLNLYEALGFERPLLATLPYVLDPSGKQKLSKRQGAKDILDYARAGYLPSALINFLATLGWNDGTTQEIFEVKELIAKFNLSRVQKGGAKFDDARLSWISGHHIRRLNPGELYQAAADFWPAEAADAPKSYKVAVLELVRERLKYFGELAGLSAFFFTPPEADAELLTGDKLNKKSAQTYLLAASACLGKNSFKKIDLETALRVQGEELRAKPVVFFGLIRRAVTGSDISPGLFETLEVIGKSEVLKRLAAALKKLA